MDIYSKKSRWKIYLAIGGIIIVAISMAFTNHLANKLAQEERKKAENWLVALERTASAGLDNCDYTLHQKILESNTTIPVILVNDRGGSIMLRILVKKGIPIRPSPATAGKHEVGRN